MKSTVTYSPEDNKLRLYVGRVPRDEYEALRAAGFISTPKQDCDFVATWTPAREDLAASYLEDDEDIGDEDYSPEERAADRAERFAGYRDKRRDEAGGHADTFDAGPQAFGHQSRARAERQAMRHDRHRVRAVSQWSKAEYWQMRTAGVISHALYRSSPDVRRGRILTLEAERRQLIASYTPTHNPPHIIMQQAYSYSTGKYLHDGAEVPHVWVGPKGRGGRWVEVAALERIKAGSERWLLHYDLRLSYERAMLENEGGTAAAVEMEPGGWLGNRQIHKVNKSPVTGRVVSVQLKVAGDRWGNSDEGYHMRSFNIERLPEGAYRAPTDEERTAFQNAKAERKAQEKASKPAAPPLINPTDEDAERLQALWNAKGKAKHDEARLNLMAEYKPSTTFRMTQAQYSANSGGTYSRFETKSVCESGYLARRSYSEAANATPIACKIRTAYGNGNSTVAPYRVIIITDKPQKPLPLDWQAIESGAVAKAPELAEVPA